MNSKVLTDSGLYLNTQESYRVVKKLDWIIIPALGDISDKIIKENSHITRWTKEKYEKGTSIISFCTGAFILAETGLLNDKKAVTHWAFEEKFKRDFSQVEVINDKIILDQENIYMCGGAGLYTNLILYLIEKHFGKELAVRLSKFSLLEMHRTARHFSVFEGQKQHNDKKILEIQNYLEENCGETITLDSLAEKFFISKRTLARRFKEKTGNTIVEYLQRVRIELAKNKLENTDAKVIEICLESGYEDLHFFNNLFKRYVGLTPSGYRKRFNLSFQ